MFKSHDILCIFTLVTASFVFDEVLKYETKVICKMHLLRIVSQKKPKRLLLFLPCHSWGKLCVPDGNIKGHGDQFKDCILLGTGRRVGRDGELKKKKSPLLRLEVLPLCPYLGVFPCKVSVHLKFWMNLILFSCVVPSKGMIKPNAS